jgi:hypothetical protein
MSRNHMFHCLFKLIIRFRQFRTIFQILTEQLLQLRTSKFASWFDFSCTTVWLNQIESGEPVKPRLVQLVKPVVEQIKPWHKGLTDSICNPVFEILVQKDHFTTIKRYKTRRVPSSHSRWHNVDGTTNTKHYIYH